MTPVLLFAERSTAPGRSEGGGEASLGSGETAGVVVGALGKKD